MLNSVELVKKYRRIQRTTFGSQFRLCNTQTKNVLRSFYDFHAIKLPKVTLSGKLFHSNFHVNVQKYILIYF